MNPLHLIVYTSQAINLAEVNNHLSDILPKSQRYNSENAITGALFFHDGSFLQFLEGAEDALRDLMKKIRQDGRHRKIEIIVDQSIQKRGFEDWSMKSFHLSEKQGMGEEELKHATEIYKLNMSIHSKTLEEFLGSYLKCDH